MEGQQINMKKTLIILCILLLLAVPSSAFDPTLVFSGVPASAELKTQIVRPTADYGADVYTASSGSDLYAMLDEVTSDDDTTYISRSGSGSNQDITIGTFNITSISIVSLTVYIVAKETGGDTSVTGAIVVNGTNYASGNIGLSTSYNTYTYTWTVNPNTAAAWTEADIEGTGSNPLQRGRFGSNIGAGETTTITQLYYEVAYY